MHLQIPATNIQLNDYITASIKIQIFELMGSIYFFQFIRVLRMWQTLMTPQWHTLVTSLCLKPSPSLSRTLPMAQLDQKTSQAMRGWLPLLVGLKDSPGALTNQQAAKIIVL